MTAPFLGSVGRLNRPPMTRGHSRFGHFSESFLEKDAHGKSKQDRQTQVPGCPLFGRECYAPSSLLHCFTSSPLHRLPALPVAPAAKCHSPARSRPRSRAAG